AALPAGEENERFRAAAAGGRAQDSEAGVVAALVADQVGVVLAAGNRGAGVLAGRGTLEVDRHAANGGEDGAGPLLGPVVILDQEHAEGRAIHGRVLCCWRVRRSLPHSSYQTLPRNGCRFNERLPPTPNHQPPGQTNPSPRTNPARLA